MNSTVEQSPAVAEAHTRRLVGALPQALLFGGTFAVTAALVAANGGFFPASWGWSALGLFWAAVAALILRTSVCMGRLELAFLALVTVCVGWIWLSVAWSIDSASSVLEGQRGLMLVAAVVAVLAVAQRDAARILPAAVLAAVTVDCAYALATRLFPARVGTYDPVVLYRLSTPVGYWNALGMLAALGAVLALGFAARGRGPTSRALAAASLLILVPTLYFTYGRGAWIALAVGILVLLALDPRRLQLAAVLIILAPAPAAGVALAAHSHALARQGSPLASAEHDGRRLAIALVLLALVAAVIAVCLRELEQRVTVGKIAHRAFAGVLVATALAAVALALAHYGSPPTMVRKAYHAFIAPPPAKGTDLNARLFSLSGNGRAKQWRVAWREAHAYPLLGSGAGTYERYYLQHRSDPAHVQDAHNLYLETLAELGPPGLALLLAALGLPLVAAARYRRRPLVPIAAAAYVVYLVHAIADWDWELAGVTLAALFCGLACVLAGREEREPPRLAARTRAGIGIAVALLGVVALLGLIGNSAVEASNAAARDGHWQSAERHAHKAIRWLPWSPEGWRLLGEAQLALHERAAARRSLHRALTKDRGDWVIWLDLGAATRGKEQISALGEAFRLNPLGNEISPFFTAVVRP